MSSAVNIDCHVDEPMIDMKANIRLNTATTTTDSGPCGLSVRFEVESYIDPASRL